MNSPPKLSVQKNSQKPIAPATQGISITSYNELRFGAAASVYAGALKHATEQKAIL